MGGTARKHWAVRIAAVSRRSRKTRDYFKQFEKATLRPAARFDPEHAFLDWHNEHCFVDRRAA